MQSGYLDGSNCLGRSGHDLGLLGTQSQRAAQSWLLVGRPGVWVGELQLDIAGSRRAGPQISAFAPWWPGTRGHWMWQAQRWQVQATVGPIPQAREGVEGGVASGGGVRARLCR